MTPYTPDNWYWQSADGRIYSSHKQALVPAADKDFMAWTEAGNLPTPWPLDDQGKATDAALANVLARQGLQLFAPTLDEVKARLLTDIDKAAEIERLKYITDGVGQAIIYQDKLAQAVDYSKQSAAQKSAASEYPLLASGLGVDGDTLAEVAETVTYAYAVWQRVSAEIETTRLKAKAAIAKAASAEAAQAIFNAVQWPKN